MKNNASNFTTRQHMAALMRYKLGHVLYHLYFHVIWLKVSVLKTVLLLCVKWTPALRSISIAYSLTVSQLVNKFPTIYGNPEFITLFRRATRLITAGSLTNPAYIIRSVFEIHFNIIPSSSFEISSYSSIPSINAIYFRNIPIKTFANKLELLKYLPMHLKDQFV
jgi:hypothetical protein